MLSLYPWPGNVRELKNLIERLITFTDADTIMLADLPPEIDKMACIQGVDGDSYSEVKKKVLDGFNRAIINRCLVKSNGNISKAAEDLRLDRANFQRLMRKYKISSREFKETDDENSKK